MTASRWTDITERGYDTHKPANTWYLTAGDKKLRVEHSMGLYYVWNGVDYCGAFRTQDDVEAAFPEPTPAPVETSDADILNAWTAKAREVADANGWTLARAQTVMLAYLRNTNPAVARTVAEAFAGPTAA